MEKSNTPYDVDFTTSFTGIVSPKALPNEADFLGFCGEVYVCPCISMLLYRLQEVLDDMLSDKVLLV